MLKNTGYDISPLFFYIKNTFSYSSLVNCNGNTRCRQDQHILPRTRTQNDDAKSVACFRLHLAYLQRISFGQGNPCSWFLSIHISAIFHHRVSRKHDRIDRVLLFVLVKMHLLSLDIYFNSRKN